MNNSKNLANAIKQAIEDCDFWRHEFVTPEHVLYAFASQDQFASASELLPHDASWLITQLEKEFLSMEVVPETQKYVIEGSQQFSEMMSLAIKQAQYSDQETLDVPHVVAAMLMLNDSQAAYLLDQFTGDEKGEFMQSLVSAYAVDETGEAADGDDANSPAPWRKLITCVNDTYAAHNPLIGREAELERTMQVLCRKDKNNPLHVGEPGVGKTALIYGLTALIERGAVPERLRGARVYMMDMGTMVAGTQFRGDFEKRIKMVMEGLAQEGNAILCIDEIHNLIGAGRNGDASLDASNMLKPYLESGTIRFIGSTTYDEYNRYIAKQKSLVRRFQQIDIAEPSVDDAIRIVEGLRPSYEKFHGVKYASGVVEFAVRSAAKHIRDRFLPDKAIDLFDEIEKAHPDIFNIFLQMMDYAALTDNHGERADFRNAIIIMTSNAGAQYASRASIGFTGSVSRGDAMLTTVKKTFKPEFINRLTDIVVFHDMSRQMASLILDKKLAQLQTKLSAKNVTLHLSAEARELLLTKGFTPEYGARELDRVIGSMLKPLLMREILFGRLKKNGDAVVDVKDGALRLV